ncbi:DUF4236 domain-containing protein [Desulfatirhabdium butyrativorans]|uniref:DUF4236 domain-containing protein n=1 Tax=Desulfatirhabdium butyrativorans TaxID=340467 RepID=UPI00048669CD
MGFRFRKSIRIAPGIRINLAKKGASLSVGTRGATVNFSSRGTRTTVGLPGTGISYSESERWPNGRSAASGSRGGGIIGWLLVIVVIWLLFKIF